MFTVLGDILKVLMGVAIKIPLCIALDLVTFFGQATERERSFTIDAIKEVFKNFCNITKPR